MLSLTLTRQRYQQFLVWIFLFWTKTSISTAFILPRTTTTATTTIATLQWKSTNAVPGALFAVSPDSETWDLTTELTAYLAKRIEQGADEAAKAEIGKTVGGTKGNKVLDFVSGSPNIPFIVQEASNIFDYDELTKYGYSHLVTPIMEAGGRLAMYKLMDIVPPPIRPKPTPKSAPKFVIDRTGKNDQARYTGLKMAMDDDSIAAALEKAQQKTKEGQRLRPKLMEEDYVMPFADKRNVGPTLTPDWTPEMLDEEGKKRGQAIAWARQAAAGAFVLDPYESMTVEGPLRVYSAVAALLCALAFGKSTPYALQEWLHVDTTDIVTLLQIPALAVIVTAIGSGVVNFAMASEKNRSQSVWFIKGLFGGPLAISQLRELERLSTQGEVDQKSEESNQLAQEKRRAAQK